jgi:hypothetical protein
MGTYREWIYPGLLLFGIAYNQFMGIADQRGWSEGFLSLFVALGSAVTIGGIALIDVEAGGLALLCFALAGGPMMIGSLVRYVRKREATQNHYRAGDG